MEQLARARIVTWEGGGLWLLSTRPAGAFEPPRTGFHAHHAVQIVFSLGGRFQLWTTDSEAAGPCVAVAPDVPHRFEAEGDYAILFVEPESRAGRGILGAILQDGGLRAASPAVLEGLSDPLSALRPPGSPDRDALTAIGRAMVDRLAGDLRQPAVDARIERVIGWVSRSQDERLTLGSAAELARLSPSRLSHLFVSETGLSFKTYLLWTRLTRAVSLMSDGLSLTEAAHGAGFADSAHFSRTFRRMFGIAPANLKLE